MFLTAVKYLKNNMLAEDAVHSAFEKIIENIKKIDDVSCPKTASYCVTISRNVSLNMLRSEHRKKFVDADDFYENIADNTNIEDEVLRKIEAELLIDKISKLPDSYREIIYLYYADGYSNKEIAKILGLSYDNARKRLQRAKNQLMSEFQEDNLGNG